VKTKAMMPPLPPQERMAAFLEVEDDDKAETEAAKLLVSPKKRKAKEVVKKRKATVLSDSDSEDDEEVRKQQEREKAQQRAREKVDQCQDERAKGREELKEVWKEMRKIGDDKKLSPHDAMRALHAVMLSATSVSTPCFRIVVRPRAAAPSVTSETHAQRLMGCDCQAPGARADHPRATVHQAAAGAVEGVCGGSGTAGDAQRLACSVPRRWQDRRRRCTHQQHGARKLDPC
jgi:hypothetical protein